MNGRQTIFTSVAEVRAIFNAVVLPAVARGEVREHVRESSVPSPRSGQPPGTRSETVLYFSGSEAIAQAHRFLLKDGTLGGSGLPDPKWVVHEGAILFPEFDL